MQNASLSVSYDNERHFDGDLMKDLLRMLLCWRYVRSFVPTDELLQSGLLLPQSVI